MLRSATCTDSCALLRFSRRPSADAWLVSRWVFTSASSCASRCFASSSSQHVLLRLDRAHQLVALHVELGAADVVARVQQRDLVVGRLDRRLRVGLDDLLLRELEIEPRLLEVELLLGGVELDDDVAGFDGVAGLGELARSAAGRPSAATASCIAREARRSPTV